MQVASGQRFIHAFAFLIPAFLGCSGSATTDETGDPPIPVADALPDSASAGRLSVGGAANPVDDATVREYAGIEYPIPLSWQELPPSPVIDSKFKISTEHGALDLTLTAMGGGIRTNIDRWVGQFQLADGDAPASDEIEIDGVKAEWIDVQGRFNGNMISGGSSEQDWRMIGVAIPLEPRDFYLKLTGPRDAVTAFSEEFRNFVVSGKLTR